jgi:hypothetical protein
VANEFKEYVDNYSGCVFLDGRTPRRLMVLEGIENSASKTILFSVVDIVDDWAAIKTPEGAAMRWADVSTYLKPLIPESKYVWTGKEGAYVYMEPARQYRKAMSHETIHWQSMELSRHLEGLKIHAYLVVAAYMNNPPPSYWEANAIIHAKRARCVPISRLFALKRADGLRVPNLLYKNNTIGVYDTARDVGILRHQYAEYSGPLRRATGMKSLFVSKTGEVP